MVNSKFINSSCLILIFTMLFFGCSKDDQEVIQEVTIPVVDDEVVMMVSENSLVFGYFEETKSFLITNEGNVPFTWS